MRWPITLTLIVITTLPGCGRAPETYSASCSKPLPNWGTEKNGIGHLVPVMSVFLGTDGTVLWHQAAITNGTLRSYMKEVSGLNPTPQIVLEVSRQLPASGFAKCVRL